VKNLFYHEEHEGYEDGIAGKVLADVTIWHVDGSSRVEIATVADALSQ
jgi:hypothetical protein